MENCVSLGELPACRVLLMNNRHFPWLILVPKGEGLREIYDLADAEYAAVMEEVRHAARQFSLLAAAHKMNVAALGNVTPQLHIHVIARYPHDAAWPRPVWNADVAPEPYAPEALAEMTEKIKRALALA